MNGTESQYPGRVIELVDKAIAAGYIKALLNSDSEEVILCEVDLPTGATVNQVAIPYGALKAAGIWGGA